MSRNISLRRPGAERLPPGPGMPSVLQAIGWALRPLGLMERAHARYGEVFTLRVRGHSPWVILSNPAHIKEVFTADSNLMGAGAGEANPLLGPLLGPRSVMLLDEPQHMNDRRHLLPSFHGGRMQAYGDMMYEVALREIATWPIGEPFALWPRMQAVSLSVVMRAVFGEDESERLQLLRERLVEMTAWINSPRRLALLAAAGSRSMTSNPGFRTAMKPVEDLVMDEVRARRLAPGGEQREDILTMLEGAYGGGGASSDGKMRDELVTMISDGPTATSLAWVFERLLRHPDKLERLREEVIHDEDEEYLNAVVTETLRLCPAVPLVMRRLAEPMQLGGFSLPAGTVVAPSVFLTHRRPDLYPDPLSFAPERFLGQSPGTYTWLPFGGGVRRCVAASFAQLEMRRVIRAVLEQVDLRAAVSGSEGVARSSVSFAPDGGALVVASRRDPRTAKSAALA
jgi:cytochrome P450 family 135